MKTLVLIRHAKSSWSDPGLADFHRGLNKRGKKDGPFMAKILAEKGVIPDQIISTPAKRAKKTAVMMAKSVGYSKDSITFIDDLYLASKEELLLTLRSIDDSHGTVFLVGHNYGITDLAETLSGKYIGNIPTSGLFGIEFPVSCWKEIGIDHGKPLFFDFPKKYK